MDLNERKHHNENGDWQWFNWWAGCGMMSNFYVYVIFENVIKNNPQIEGIVEVGTGKGGMVLGLANIAFAYQKNIASCDIAPDITIEAKRVLERLNCPVYVADVFDPEFKTAVLDEFFESPVYLICDGGNKAKEFEIFVPLLPSGSIVSVHDYGTEFLDEHWQIYADRLEPFMPEDWNRHNVQMCTFKVK